ncbi:MULTISPECIES: hypothetical protein [Mycobacteroides]|uniref:hypothetical protein n=1 Tax=Mycobacteroides TaxID=670516 RepID=UPI0009263355|nr:MULTISPECIES: hypothetical protein [Mycobacteroides]MBN7333026.1 hypothetical protein [Mycobacteroides abscessus subsp. abscessus]SHP46007.1 Uncharacterised protein [Mycobacteroides abscessus subsp. abscessus]SIE74374.1 Uncharacterised protein [Mycobacteroides abscessus subsp. abscessus]SIG27115.1 Uncharacterised protein [Mycobacteroides abscessus subsp. abscessus]SIG38871.1 Uncharacterised protein [Mycobacteroides abscessus subsp. abscessus]
MSSTDPADEGQDRSMYPAWAQDYMAKEREWHRFLRGTGAMNADNWQAEHHPATDEDSV